EMDLMKKGAIQAIKNCLDVKEGEMVIIITDTETLDIGACLREAAKEVTDETKLFIVEDYQKRPLKKIPQEIEEGIKSSSVGILAMQGKKGELMDFRRPLLTLAQENGLRFANMININQQIMQQGMSADYKIIRDYSSKVYSIVKDAFHIEVKTKKGTDLLFEFSPQIKWVSGDGFIKKGEWSNLPDGEVFTCPVNVNGTAVIDGVLGDYLAAKYGVLEKNPLKVVIKGGKAVSVVCSNNELQKDFNELINTDENASRIGEFAIGTNIFIKELIGRLLQDEKFPGVHIAFGHGYPQKTGVKWKSGVHIDGVIKFPTVLVDGKKIMSEGEFLI
ncbi:MAG: aminopeptidase, partial [Nanoarchaeota archaeon]